MSSVAIADRDHEHHLHDPQTFITKYIWSQDHKVIAIQYGIVATAIGLVALGLSVLMRLQLVRPENTFLTPNQYNEFFTMHGSTMMYLFTVPILEGFAILLHELQREYQVILIDTPPARQCADAPGDRRPD